MRYSAETTSPSTSLRLLTLNIAHGRSRGLHQLLVSNRQISANLKRVAHVIDREQAQVVAIQEADTFSAWNGNYSHVDLIARECGSSCSVSGKHVDAPGVTYGCALLAETELHDPLSVTFSASTVGPKGFTIAAVELAERLVDVVSLHLDFARREVQLQQLAELQEHLARRARPAVVMGDFNVHVGHVNSVSMLLAEMGLRGYEPQSAGQATYPRFDKRLDWILCSAEFTFTNYTVIPDKLSDHLAVVAEVKLKC